METKHMARLRGMVAQVNHRQPIDWQGQNSASAAHTCHRRHGLAIRAHANMVNTFNLLGEDLWAGSIGKILFRRATTKFEKHTRLRLGAARSDQ